jgi:DNA-binding CsgD family transcriptional regulator
MKALTAYQKEVLRLKYEGHSIKETAVLLHRAIPAIKAQRREAMTKLENGAGKIVVIILIKGV